MSKTLYGEFSAENEDGDPTGDDQLLSENDVSGNGKYLVRKRIEELSKLRDKIQLACIVSVKEIREASKDCENVTDLFKDKKMG